MKGIEMKNQEPIYKYLNHIGRFTNHINLSEVYTKNSYLKDGITEGDVHSALEKVAIVK